MATHKLLLLPGDGIGPEVMAEVKRLIDWLNAQGLAHFETEQGLVGGSAYDADKVAITDATMALAQASDAVIFGAVGGPKWDHVPYDVRPEAGLLRLRKEMALFANLRPAICYPALADASSLKREVVEGLDIMIVRELTGGVYFGEPKTITDLGNGQKRAVDTQVYDTYEIERIARVAFDLARKRRNKLTSMEKRNVMKSGVLWNEVVGQVHAREYKDVQLEHQLADSGGMNLVKWPKQFDVIVTDNLFGDMLSDIAAMLTGSLGMLPSASLGEVDVKTKKRKSLYRAGARLGARYCRQGIGQSDRDDRIVRHGAALFVRHGSAGRQVDAAIAAVLTERSAHRRHQVRRHDGGQHDADGRGDRERIAGVAGVKVVHHARACRGHPRLAFLYEGPTETRMAGTSPAMTKLGRYRPRINTAGSLSDIRRDQRTGTAADESSGRFKFSLRERRRLRKGVVVELAIAGQHLDAGIEPRALGDVNPRAVPTDTTVRTGRTISVPLPLVAAAPLTLAGFRLVWASAWVAPRLIASTPTHGERKNLVAAGNLESSRPLGLADRHFRLGSL